MALLLGITSTALSSDIAIDEAITSNFNLVNADEAHSLGYSGEGTCVIIADTYIDKVHDQIKESLILKKSGTFFTDAVANNHAAVIGGIIAAKKDNNGIAGVAYNAKLINLSLSTHGLTSYILDNTSVRIINKSFEGISEEVEDGDGEPIVEKNSKLTMERFDDNDASMLRSTKDSYLDDLMNLYQKDSVMVYAAGNEGALSTYVLSGGIAKWYPEAARKTIVTVASDRFNRPAYFSNLAVNMEKYTITAPGEGIYGLEGENDYRIVDGTSFAAPYVSSALALVQEAYPFLTAKQLVDTVLSTANNEFQAPRYFVSLKLSKGNNNLGSGIDAVNVIYIDSKKPSTKTAVIKDIEDYFNDKPRKVVDNIIHIFKSNGEVYELSKASVYGQGLLDCGKAVKGISRLDDSRGDLIKNINGKEYPMLFIDTGKIVNNFKQNSFTSFKNNISEVSGSMGLEKKGEVTLRLDGYNTYTGPTVVSGGRLLSTNHLDSDLIILNGSDAVVNGGCKNIIVDENSSFSVVSSPKGVRNTVVNGNILVKDRIDILTVKDLRNILTKEDYRKLAPKTKEPEEKNTVEKEDKDKAGLNKIRIKLPDLFDSAFTKAFIKKMNEDLNKADDNYLYDNEKKMLNSLFPKKTADVSTVSQLKHRNVVEILNESYINGAIVDSAKNPIDLVIDLNSYWNIKSSSEIHGTFTLGKRGFIEFNKSDLDSSLTLANVKSDSGTITLNISTESLISNKVVVTDQSEGRLFVNFNPLGKGSLLTEKPILFAETKGNIEIVPDILVHNDKVFVPEIMVENKGDTKRWFVSRFREAGVKGMLFYKRYVIKKANL